MIVGGYFHKLIEQNTTVPTDARPHLHDRSRTTRPSVKILVLQGESDRAEENELLGEFILTGLRRAPKGEVEIEVKFEIGADGIVSVTAKDMETGLEQSITVTATSGLTEDEIRRMVDENKDYLVELRSSRGVREAAARASRSSSTRSRACSPRSARSSPAPAMARMRSRRPAPRSRSRGLPSRPRTSRPWSSRVSSCRARSTCSRASYRRLASAEVLPWPRHSPRASRRGSRSWSSAAS